MAGTKLGGRKMSCTIKEKYDTVYLEKYGMTFHQHIGSIGGKRSNNGGFGSVKIGDDGLTGRERARIVGSIGGRRSKRGKAKHDTGKI